MSEVETLSDARALDLPATRESPQGAADVGVEKIILITYQGNRPIIPHLLDTRLAAPLVNFEASFVTPDNKRRTIHSIYCQYIMSATVGTRTFHIQKLDKDNNQPITELFTSVAGTFTANTTKRIHIGPIRPGLSDDYSIYNVVHAEARIHLEPGWVIRFRDFSAIDTNDLLYWKIEYTEKTIT